MMERQITLDMPDPVKDVIAWTLVLTGLLGMIISVPWESDFVRFIGIIGFLLGFAVACIKGKLILNEEGIQTVRLFSRSELIPYDDVDWVYLDVEVGKRGNSRGISPSPYPLVHQMTIVTKTGNITVKKIHGDIFNRSELYGGLGKDRFLLDSPFRKAEEFIREKKGLVNEPDHVKILKMYNGAKLWVRR